MKRYRVFTNDVGPDAYSCLTVSKAASATAALDAAAESARRDFPGAKVLVIADERGALDDFGPDGRTGRLPISAKLARGRAAGLVAGPKRV